MVIILLITVDINKELGKKIRELRREISHEELVHCYQSKSGCDKWAPFLFVELLSKLFGNPVLAIIHL
jgi:hypothetical protein